MGGFDAGWVCGCVCVCGGGAEEREKGGRGVCARVRSSPALPSLALCRRFPRVISCENKEGLNYKGSLAAAALWPEEGTARVSARVRAEKERRRGRRFPALSSLQDTALQQSGSTDFVPGVVLAKRLGNKGHAWCPDKPAIDVGSIRRPLPAKLPETNPKQTEDCGGSAELPLGDAQCGGPRRGVWV